MNRTFRKDADYWNGKLQAYLHDPPDKALHIPGHEARSRKLLDAMGIDGTLDKAAYSGLDAIAAGMDRMQFPGFSKDDESSGAIDFSTEPKLTHPTSREGELKILGQIPDIKAIGSQMAAMVGEDISLLANSFTGKPEEMAAARFHYVHHALRGQLIKKNLGGLGGLWAKMPADTRIPDHSVWQHCALVSALYSCSQLSKTRQASLMVFGLTPVQDFIVRARKLRDFWTGSLILSWLAFEGIRQVVYDLGSDHILYPSLIDQPMIENLLADECSLDKLGLFVAPETGVASFPNKFVCLVPAGEEEVMANSIESGIVDAWKDMGSKVLDLIEKHAGQDKMVRALFAKQLGGYFDFHWSSCPLIDETSIQTASELLPEQVWTQSLEIFNDSKGLPYPIRGKGAFYGTVHGLAQGFMAAGKTCKKEKRSPEEGIKCQLHGDLEILHLDHETTKDKNPRPENDPFWSTFKEKWAASMGGEADFKESERLSSVAMIKRLAGYAIHKDKKHPLYPFFKDDNSFPATTEMALSDWFTRLGADTRRGLERDLGSKWKMRIADQFHALDEDGDSQDQDTALLHAIKQKHPITEADKYYAVLLMDGDKMGRLVNGETIAANWSNVIHPRLVEKLRSWPKGRDGYRQFWDSYLDKKRMLSPAVHAAISEALGDFALHTVPHIVEMNRGRLIYAGGDDVCAVLPVSTVLQAARDIAIAYNYPFLCLENGRPAPVKDTWTPSNGRLFHHLGTGDDISISAGILLTHHKRPLIGALKRAHQLLDEAKEKGGRDCLALELDKRSGGARSFMASWKDTPTKNLALDPKDSRDNGDALIMRRTLVELFMDIAVQLGRPEFKDMSSSFIYRLEMYRDGLLTLAEQKPDGMFKFLRNQLGRSTHNRMSGERGDNKNKELDDLAKKCAALVMRWTKDGKVVIDTTALVIARFMGQRFAGLKEDTHEKD
ncbi:MAG: type III-B CRISPR-associated protein Cas10/Cmr2 [Desulfovibrionales bacterium]|nr:MAG: type III-B CRISPR-associated protein Cas10/Cmr2 [Desulfovibrionales bacterium]